MFLKSLKFILSLVLLSNVIDAKVTEICKFPELLVRAQEIPYKDGVCVKMVPGLGEYPKQYSPSPWSIYIWEKTIQQSHTQPSSVAGVDIFKGYLITARAKPSGQIVGHFEPHFDANPVCCGNTTQPNLLESSNVRERLNYPNLTVLWTAPNDYLGPVTIMATLWKSSRIYWQDITSPEIKIVPRKVKYL